MQSAFERIGIEAECLFADDNTLFDRSVIHRINKLAHKLRVIPKSPDRKLETGRGTPGAQQTRSGATQDNRASESNPNTPRHGTMRGRYHQRRDRVKRDPCAS